MYTLEEIRKQLQDLWNLIFKVRSESPTFSGTYTVVLNTYNQG